MISIVVAVDVVGAVDTDADLGFGTIDPKAMLISVY
jgi:hypothetical protein